jgi:flagellar biosynthesis/type III secretory pathway protein FliH
VKDREELLAKARRDAETIVEDARQEQLRMASREAVVQRANEESARILQEASDDARRLRLESEDYVDAKLAQLEHALQTILENMLASNDSLTKVIDQVRAGRDKLRAGAPATNAEIGPDVAFPEDEES